METFIRYRGGAILLFAAALAGVVLAGYAYFRPLSGVTGSGGALLAAAASLVLALAALILPMVKRRNMRNLLRVLILLGLLGTFFAGLLLHQWFIAAAMVVGLIGLLIDMTRRAQAAPTHAAEG